MADDTFDQGYKLEIDREGGICEVHSCQQSSVELEVFRSETGLRMSMDAMARHGQFSVGVGLSPHQARKLAYELLTRAEDMDDKEE